MRSAAKQVKWLHILQRQEGLDRAPNLEFEGFFPSIPDRGPLMGAQTR